MPTLTGKLYRSGLITTDGDSGWLDVMGRMGLGARGINPLSGILRASIKLLPIGVQENEKLDVSLHLAWNAAGIGRVMVHEFDQIDAGNREALVLIPGGESEGLMAPGGASGVAMPPYWQFVHVLEGESPSLRYAAFVSLEY